MFLYVLSAPEWLGTHLGLGPTQFFWFFGLTIGGIMAGAFLSGRMAGRTPPRRQIRVGFIIMTAVSALNVGLNLLLPPHPGWALLPPGDAGLTRRVKAAGPAWTVVERKGMLIMCDDDAISSKNLSKIFN